MCPTIILITSFVRTNTINLHPLVNPPSVEEPAEADVRCYLITVGRLTGVTDHK